MAIVIELHEIEKGLEIDLNLKTLKTSFKENGQLERSPTCWDSWILVETIDDFMKD